MKSSRLIRKKITFTQGEHKSFPYKLATTPKDRAKSLQLLYVLQRLAYPEFKPGIRMNKNVVRLILPKASRKKT